MAALAALQTALSARLQLSQRPGWPAAPWRPAKQPLIDAAIARQQQAPRQCCRASGSGSDALPSNGAEVAGWAAAAFREAVAKSNLLKACLLLALEEEAAGQAAYAEAEQLVGGPGRVGSASTWSADRVARLAEEAARAFCFALSELGVTDGIASVAGEAPDSTLLTLHMDLVRSYPTQLISAVNAVLFERHGYRRQRRFGDPRDSQLSSVLESGSGSPGALAVLYLEICERLSLPLRPVALEGGRFFVLVLADDTVSLAAAGEQFCIDPYSEGMLLSQAEVCELFEVPGGKLEPCSTEALLSGILRALLDSHWCSAVGCPPEPILMVPISVEVALGEYRDVEVQTSGGQDEQGEYFRVSFTEPDPEQQGNGGQQWWPRQGLHLQRALAAAQKRSWLLPSDLRAQLEYGLLLFFCSKYEDAWQELGCVLQATRGEPPEQQTFGEEELGRLEVLVEKVRLQLAFSTS